MQNPVAGNRRREAGRTRSGLTGLKTFPPGNRGNFIFRNYSDSVLQFPIQILDFGSRGHKQHTHARGQDDDNSSKQRG